MQHDTELSWDANAVRQAISDRMQEIGMSQNALARAANFSKGSLSEFMNGKRQHGDLQLDSVRRIAAALGWTVGQLLGEAGDEAARAAAEGAAIDAWPHDRIRPNPDNPRTTFDANSLDELGLSILHNGLVVPMTVRHDGTLIDGERRWRAIGRLIGAGRIAPDTAWPVFVRAHDGEGDVIASLVANLQREDIPPLEQALAIQALVAKHDWTTAKIAERLGVSQRHVQLRLALVEKLIPRAQDALAAGDITLAAARLLCSAPPDQQESALPEIVFGSAGWDTIDNISRNLFRGAVPVGRNAFRLEDYDGEIFEHPDDPKRRFFADRARFIRHQRKACENMMADLAGEGFRAVHFVDGTRFEEFDHVGKIIDQTRPAEDCEAVVELQADLQVIVHRHICDAPKDVLQQTLDGARRAAQAAPSGGDTGGGDDAGDAGDDDPFGLPPLADQPAPTAAPADTEEEPLPMEPAMVTKAHIIACKQAKTAALQDAIMAQPDMALRAATLALMAYTKTVKLRRGDIRRDDHANRNAIYAAAEPYAAPFRHLRADFMPTKHPLHIDPWKETHHAAALEILAGLPANDVRQIFAILMAEFVGCWVDNDPQLGDDLLTIEMAAALRVQMDRHFELSDGFLATCSRPMLLEILRASGTEIGAAELRGKTRADLVSIIERARADGKLDGYVPPAAHFGTSFELEAKLPRKGG